MDGSKAAIRQEMRRRRRALSGAELAAAEEAVTAHVLALESFRTASTVLAYVATDREVPTGAVIETAFATGKRVFLPRMDGDAMTFAEHERGADLRPGARGIAEPLGTDIEARAMADAIALIPLLAFDASGARIGRGGGHYDRAFAGAARPRCLVGMAYSFQQCATAPRDPWDLQLDWVVTEHGATRCWHGGDPSPSGKEGGEHNGLSGDGAGRHRVGRRTRLGAGLPPAPAS